jgi:aminoglycoside phosphotransferase (APT) family kinase protein
MNEQLHDALPLLLGRILPGFGELLACDRLTGGASQETWRLRVSVDSGEQLLALRRSSGAKMEAGGISLTTEAQLIRLAGEQGIPVPEVLHILTPADGLGQGFVMGWLEGETLGNRIARHEDFAVIRPRLARQCGEILGRLHGIDIEGIALDSPLRRETPEDLVRATWQLYQSYQTPQPMIDFSARWLLDHLPDVNELQLVHGDFRNGNLMVSPGLGVVGVLDWELAAIGDPVRDLGWLCTNSWRFGNHEQTVGGFGETGELLAGYESTSGRRVSPEHLRFWMVFGSFWWSVGCLTMAASYRAGLEASLERPGIGRRSSECQMDCVNLLIPGEFPALGPAREETDPLPTVDELLGSVTGWLAGDLLSETRGRSRFLARVASNSLAIVQRQLQFGPALEAAEAERLGGLLGAGGNLSEMRWRLVHALRDGSMALDEAGLAEHLRLTTAGQLQVDQPRYSALRAGDTGAG